MTRTSAESKKDNRTVIDQYGHSYLLTGRLGEGGQGIVCTTNYPNVLIKIVRASTLEKQQSWVNKIKALMRQPLKDLPIAYPVALITEPKPGYVMELMDGLVPMTVQIQEATDALMTEDGVSAYIKTGGLLRRLKLLARLARILADLHGRGLAYGDLSPANVFVSQSQEYSEVWLIDADNISSLSRDSQQGVFTPDYGAPEIIRLEAGISTSTDNWSFAVIAFRLLTLSHPLKGDLVLEGEPEIEESALRGEMPWVDHPSDTSNSLSLGLPREVTMSNSMRALFSRCFNEGLSRPEERPSMSEWAEVLEATTCHCSKCESCNSTFIFNSKRVCPFCEHIQNENRSLVLQEFRYTPPELIRDNLSSDIPDSFVLGECWTRTGKAIVLGQTSIELKQLPFGNSLFATAEPLCKIELTDEGLWFEPISDSSISLQKASTEKVVFVSRKQKLKAESKSGASFWLHLGEIEKEHTVWRFVW